MCAYQMSDQDKVFFEDGLRLAEASLEEGLNRKSLLSITRQAQMAIDGLIDAITTEAKKQEVPLDCRKGCSWCCHQPIFATSHEMFFVWEFIKLNFSEDEQKGIVQRAFDNYQKRGRMTDAQMLASKMPCPMLKNGSCSIYPARPVACRIYLSMSEPSCKAFYDDPEKDENFPQLFEFPLQAGRMVNEGINKGLHNARLNNREVLIEEGLLLAHNHGEPLGDDLQNLPLFGS